MATVSEYLQGVSVTRESLLALGKSMSDFAHPYDADELGAPEHYPKYGSKGVCVRVNSYSIATMNVDDGQESALSDTSFLADVPSQAMNLEVTFHIWSGLETQGDRCGLRKSRYLRIASYGGPGANLTAFGEGLDPIAILQKAKKVLEAIPSPSSELMSGMPFQVFVGHGGDRQWEVVRDFLTAADIDNVTFESDERAGYATLETVAQMIYGAKVSVCVMTASDKMVDKTSRARENVVHEIGFSQGALGVANTIILLENGVSEFTNIAGLTQIRFDRGEIHTTRERVIAAIEARRQ